MPVPPMIEGEGTGRGKANADETPGKGTSADTVEGVHV